MLRYILEGPFDGSMYLTFSDKTAFLTASGVLGSLLPDFFFTGIMTEKVYTGGFPSL